MRFVLHELREVYSTELDLNEYVKMYDTTKKDIEEDSNIAVIFVDDGESILPSTRRLYEYASYNAKKAYDLIVLILPRAFDAENQSKYFEALSIVLHEIKEKVYVVRSGEINNQVDEILWFIANRTKFMISNVQFKEC